MIETQIIWNTDVDSEYLEDNELYIVTLEKNDGQRYVDYIQLHRGDWCCQTDEKVVAWAYVKPYGVSK